MALISNSRKRARPQEDYDYELQSKQFVNDQIINMNNQNKMKEIHGKFYLSLISNATKFYVLL